MNRRVFLSLPAAACALAGCRKAVPAEPAPSVGGEPARPRTADEALAELLAGNRRFMTVMGDHKHVSGKWRMSLADQQHPFAVVVGCADSRVSPEIVFDQGLGDLFVIREAGHVIDAATLASVEYAVGHLNSPLVLVLGHEGCGAVQATITAMGREDKAEGHLGRLVKAVRPAVEQARKQPGPLFDRAVRANITLAVGQMRASRPLLAPWVAEQRCRIVGAYYNLHTGKVEVTEA